ncbi:MAG TPA: HypC/HybG/HupF family hydrogenase formation chaperone [Ktedonobacteraceae bacterium]|nr:HypC/HybG/HupF family hydrogenase formation chaperone [Ktedonobacteraceae bacterium]
MNDISGKTPSSSCQVDADQHCLTCSDEAVAVRVVRLDQEAGLACVEMNNQVEEIDVTLVENVVVGDVLLAHGGVAIARLEQGQTHEH